MKKAPIAFFAYKRPEHTRRSLESLSQNEGAEESDLFIFCEAPKGSEDRESVRQVREVVRSKQWCRTVHLIERETNLGCANSIISGVTELCDRYGRVIVVEDDLILSSFFLDYMNAALNLYEDNPRVMQISGHMFPVKLNLATDAFFLPFISSWGWATWQGAWKNFDAKMSAYSLLKKNYTFIYKFNLNGSYPYFEMLESQLNGQIDSWAIRWYLSTFMLGGLTLYPVGSLVKNIGFDGSGTHGSPTWDRETFFVHEKIKNFPHYVIENPKAVKAVFDYLRHLTKPQGVPRQLMSFLQKIKTLKYGF